MAVDKFLIDTNVISNSYKKRPHPRLTEWMCTGVQLAIPFPVFLEVQIGIAEKRRTNPAKADCLAHWFQTVQESIFTYPEATPEVATLLGSMMCCRPLTHLWGAYSPPTSKPGQDLFIAAIAIVHRLPIATLDTRDFERIHEFFPLPGVYNPAFDVWIVNQGQNVFNRERVDTA